MICFGVCSHWKFELKIISFCWLWLLFIEFAFDHLWFLCRRLYVLIIFYGLFLILFLIFFGQGLFKFPFQTLVFFSQFSLLLLFSSRLFLHLHSQLLFVCILFVCLSLGGLGVNYEKTSSEGLVWTHWYFWISDEVRFPAVIRDIVYK